MVISVGLGGVVVISVGLGGGPLLRHEVGVNLTVADRLKPILLVGDRLEGVPIRLGGVKVVRMGWGLRQVGASWLCRSGCGS